MFDSILLKDVAKRHNVRNMTDLYNLATYLLSNFCNLISANQLASERGLASVATTKKFCDYLAEPYLFFYLPRFNNKLKLIVVDNDFVQSMAFNPSENLLVITNSQEEKIEWKNKIIYLKSAILLTFGNRNNY